jgi:hypothetical protein
MVGKMDATLAAGGWKAVSEAVAIESIEQWNGGVEANALCMPWLVPE